MATTIHSNGSKWAGQAPDSIATLLEVMQAHPLNRTLFGETYTHELETGATCFHGNFLTLSHVFRIETDEPDTIAALTAAIEANKARPDYLAQPTREAAQAAAETEARARLEARAKARRDDARRVLGLPAQVPA